LIRLATHTDTVSLLNIYAPFIKGAGITQETELPTIEVFNERIQTTLLQRPWLVAEIDGQIAGYAYADKYRNRQGYQWCTETSVYLHPDFCGKGIATALYNALFDLLQFQGYINAYAIITLPNPASIAFHEKFGFQYLTTFRSVGYKQEQWLDVGWWSFRIQEPTPQPRLLSIQEINTSIMQQIFETAAAGIRH
jgi:phosphinothricin acetyltransferase